jgi:hypothetical protein
MPSAFQTIKTAMERSAPDGQEPKWWELCSEFGMVVTSSTITDEVKSLLLEILRFDGELQLDEKSPMPHCMSPEKMLK